MKVYNLLNSRICYIRNQIPCTKKDLLDCAKTIGDRANPLLLMDFLHKNIGLAGRSMAQKTICALPLHRFALHNKSFFDDESVDEESAFESLRWLMRQKRQEFTSLDTIVCTTSLSSKILAYGVFCKAINSSPIPLEEWNFFALMLGPWWSSAYWVEWVCYDFFRSAFAKDPYNIEQTSNPDFISKWFPYELHPELNWAYKYDKKSFYFSAVIILSLYASMLYVRPQISRILIKKLGDLWGPYFTEIMAKNTLDFVRVHCNEIKDDLPQAQFDEFRSCVSRLQRSEKELAGLLEQKKYSPGVMQQRLESQVKVIICLNALSSFIRELPSCHNLYCLPEDRLDF